MNVEKLITAAKEIERLREKQKERTRSWQKLAVDAKDKTIDRREIERRRAELDVCNVVDFSTAIDSLCAALNSR